MRADAAFLALVLLAGCASSAEPVPSAAPAAASPPAATSVARPLYAAPAPRRVVSTRPSDWALAIVGTPFVFGFRAVVCAASAVVAGPTAALFAVSDDPRGGFDYLRDGLAQNCGPPYAVGVPVTTARPRVPAPAPAQDLAPRPLTPYASAAVTSF
jgi:hypothetical protein